MRRQRSAAPPACPHTSLSIHPRSAKELPTCETGNLSTETDVHRIEGGDAKSSDGALRDDRISLLEYRIVLRALLI